MAAKDYANTRYSQLSEITPENIGRLRVAWSRSTGVLAGHEAAPLVVGSTMYVVTPFPNVVLAIDLASPGGPVRWRYDAMSEGAARGVACCDVVNRGAAFWNGLVIFNTLDGRTIALDAETGAERWVAELGDITRGETLTMAPIVVKDKVLVGNSGGEFGVRGWLTALDVGTGRTMWRAYSTGPDSEVLIGPEFSPFYAQDRGTDLGVKSWPPDAWRTGGGTSWGWLSYDPDLDLVYQGTANPGPWNPEQRPGDNKWTAGIFARDPDTGAARWFYQWSPHDLYDHDGVNENVLLDLPIDGGVRRVLVHPERNGHMYVLDRATGEVLSATPFVPITASRGVDPKTGWLIPEEPEAAPGGGRARHLPRCTRRQGLAAVVVLAADGLAVRAAQQLVHGLRGPGGELHRRNAIRRRDGRVLPRYARRGLAIFAGTSCAMCHAVRGTTAGARAAPDLTHVASRLTIAAGLLPMSRPALAAWIAAPQHLKPGNKMPNIELSREDVNALAAYLETLR